MAVIEHFQQVATVGVVEHREPPTIDDKHAYPRQLLEQLHAAHVGAPDALFVKQARQTHVVGTAARAARLVRQRASEPGLAHAGGAGKQHVLFFRQPQPCQQPLIQRLVEPARVAVVSVLGGGTGLELGSMQAQRQRFAITLAHLVFDQQAEAFFESKVVQVQRALFGEGACHAEHFNGSVCRR